MNDETAVAAAKRTMIRFGDEHRRFSMRVGAVILHEGRVLVERGEENGAEYWFLPGGRAEIGEPSAETLRREMIEELGVEIEVGRLTHVIEYFFALDGIAYHQLALYFVVTLPDSYLVNTPGPYFRNDGEVDLHFDWLPVDGLSRHTLYPRYFEEGTLADLPASPVHVIVHEDSAPP